MKYHFRIHEENGFWAECIELSGCFTQADTIEELYDNMYEALKLYLEETELSPYQIEILSPQDISIVLHKPS